MSSPLGRPVGWLGWHMGWWLGWAGYSTHCSCRLCTLCVQHATRPAALTSHLHKHPTPPSRCCSSVGTAFAYASSLLYLTSRVSQIIKNHQRQSAEGLAISMFVCAMAANSLYGASILIRSYTWPQLCSSLPWLIGSLGTVLLDATIFAQARRLAAGAGGGVGGAQKQHPSDEDEPLLLPPA